MASAEVRVEVVLAVAARRIERRELTLPAGSTAGDAVRASGLLDTLAGEETADFQLGCWSRSCAPDALLRDRDRVELTRSLHVDPKEARRLRYRRDGLSRPLRAARR